MTMLNFQDKPTDEMSELYNELLAMRKTVCQKMKVGVRGTDARGVPVVSLGVRSLTHLLSPMLTDFVVNGQVRATLGGGQGSGLFENEYDPNSTGSSRRGGAGAGGFAEKIHAQMRARRAARIRKQQARFEARNKVDTVISRARERRARESFESRRKARQDAREALRALMDGLRFHRKPRKVRNSGTYSFFG